MDDDNELNRLRERLRKSEASLEEERGRRQAAEQRTLEEQQRALEEQQTYDKVTGKTTLPDFLNACHVHLSLGLNIQKDSTKSTQGSPSNVNRKLRPNKIRVWAGFAQQQATIWEDLMESDFIEKRHFTSLHTLKESGEPIRRHQMSSEIDLHQFARLTVHDPVASIIERLWEDSSLRSLFGLKGSVRFESHANMLSPDRMSERSQELGVSERPRRRSPRLQAHVHNAEWAPSEGSAKPIHASHSPRPRADQFCVYNFSGDYNTDERMVAAFIVEYKPPHKLTLSHIYEGLGDMDVDDIIRESEDEGMIPRCRRLIASVITQAFSYMVQAGLEFGYVFTGEAFIFLRIPEDPSMVYYFLSAPKADVGPTTGWDPTIDEHNRLHLTAVGQALAFTLRALRGSPRDLTWQENAKSCLKTWEVVIEELWVDIPEPKILSSEYRPPDNETELYTRMSPIRFRPRRLEIARAVCSKPAESVSNDYSDNEDGDDCDPNTPSRQAPAKPTVSSAADVSSSSKEPQASRNASGLHRQRDLGPFCSSACLLGLIRGSELDQSCPNVADHKSHHHIGRKAFLSQMRQLFNSQLEQCETLYIHGSRGALFKAKLPHWGYTVAVKGTGIECVDDLRHESAVYERLQPLQGRYVPVHLGSLDLDRPFHYVGAVRIVHVILMSFEGFPLNSTSANVTIMDEAIRGIAAIHALGVLHRDIAPRNLLLQPKGQRPIWHDFERAMLVETRQTLGKLSPNRKRKQSADEKSQVNSSGFKIELSRTESLFNRLARAI